MFIQQDAPLPCVPAVGSLEASPSSTPLVPAEEPGIRTVVITAPALTDVESRASFSAVVEGPRAPTPDSFPDSFPALGDAEEELDGEVNAYGETVSTLGAHHEPPVSTTDGEDDGSDSRFYDTRVRGYEQTVYEDTEDDGSDSIDPNNPVINVMRLPDAFVERHLWDLPELLTPHGRYPLEYDDAPSLTRTPHSKTASRELLESRTTTASTRTLRTTTASGKCANLLPLPRRKRRTRARTTGPPARSTPARATSWRCCARRWASASLRGSRSGASSCEFIFILVQYGRLD